MSVTAMRLEELVKEVERQLMEHRLLEGQPDGRVAASPDARTIRYYTTLGLLDHPGMEGRQARYGERHLLQVLAIKALQAARLPLSEVQARLYGRTDAELRALWEAVVATRPPAPLHCITWREVTLEPGLKLLCDERWVPPEDPSALIERIQTTLTALGSGGRAR